MNNLSQSNDDPYMVQVVAFVRQPGEDPELHATPYVLNTSGMTQGSLTWTMATEGYVFAPTQAITFTSPDIPEWMYGESVTSSDGKQVTVSYQNPNLTNSMAYCYQITVNNTNYVKSITFDPVVQNQGN